MTHVAIVGAGPAGLAAASAALRAGTEVSVTLIDQAASLGGQFWRHLPAWRPARHQDRLHHGWRQFRALEHAVVSNPRCEVLTGASVWAVEPADAGSGPVLRLAIGEADGARREQRTLVPDALVVATGAHDLTLPFPGWDLPGVFTGGAAQAIAKAERVAIGERVVVAGAGPFLLPVVASLTATGAGVVGVFEASRVPRLAKGWSGGASALVRMPHKLGELAGYVRGQLRHRVPYRIGAGVIAAHGTDRVESVTVAELDAEWAPIAGTEHTIACDAVAVSHGFTPRLELAIAAGAQVTDAGPWARFVEVDDDQRTSVPTVFAAGELTGIGGADAALREGALAGWMAAGGDPADRRAASARRQIRAQRAFSRALDAAHGIRPGWTAWLDDDTTVCRCEETSYGHLCGTLDATGSRSLRALKLTTRAGLGPCQGRICGRAVEAIAASRVGPALDGVTPDRRPIAVPVRFAEAAALASPAHKAPAAHASHDPSTHPCTNHHEGHEQ